MHLPRHIFQLASRSFSMLVLVKHLFMQISVKFCSKLNYFSYSLVGLQPLFLPPPNILLKNQNYYLLKIIKISLIKNYTIYIIMNNPRTKPQPYVIKLFKSTKPNPEYVNTGKNVARQVMSKYDRDRNGMLDKKQIIPMMIDAYRPLNKEYYPSNIEVQSYIRMLDHDGDGKVSLRDLQRTCIRYFSQKM